MRTGILILFCFAGSVVTDLAAQPVFSGTVSTMLSVAADIDSALIVLNGGVVGRTPLEGKVVAPGEYLLRLVHPDLSNWLAPVMEDSVRIDAGEHPELFYRFDRRLMIRSEPSGASVRNGEAVIGSTPLVFDPEDDDSLLILQRPGYLTVAVPLSGAKRGIISAVLEPEAGTVPADFGIVEQRQGPATLPLVLSGVSTVVAGGFAAYFKTKADQNYSEYLATGDPRKRVETRRLDSISNIALAASQMYLALFAYLLLSP